MNLRRKSMRQPRTRRRGELETPQPRTAQLVCYISAQRDPRAIASASRVADKKPAERPLSRGAAKAWGFPEPARESPKLKKPCGVRPAAKGGESWGYKGA